MPKMPRPAFSSTPAVPGLGSAPPPSLEGSAKLFDPTKSTCQFSDSRYMPGEDKSNLNGSFYVENKEI